MLREPLATLRDATLLLLRGLVPLSLPLIALTLAGAQATGWLYSQLAELPWALRLGVAAWSTAAGVAAVVAIGTLLTATYSGLCRVPRRHGAWRLLRVWLIQCLWLLVPALLAAGLAALLGDVLRDPVGAYAEARLQAPWTTAPALELATGLGLHALTLTISATWLWPPVALLHRDGRIGDARPHARRLLQQAVGLEWFLMLALGPALALSLLYEPAGLLGVLLIILCPAITIIALQRNNHAYRRTATPHLPLTWP
ncbi:MAG: hypothetical protein ACLFRW_06295 [Halorhodospira sp.]